jgi:hypothetical protein
MVFWCVWCVWLIVGGCLCIKNVFFWLGCFYMCVGGGFYWFGKFEWDLGGNINEIDYM